MPEIIEVKLYADFIKKKINKTKLLNIKILKGRYKTHGPFENYKNINSILPSNILKISTKGKFMYMEVNDNYFIGIGLGLTGGWIFKDNNQLKYEHGHSTARFDPDTIDNYFKRTLNNLNVEFIFENGSLYYYDQLSFGTIKIYESIKQINDKLNTIGIDIMDPTTSIVQFTEKIRLHKNLKKFIGIVLLDQSIVAGIGNYLRADLLWLTRISPFRYVKDITNKELESLFINIRLLLWSTYNYEKAVKLKIIKNGLKLPVDYLNVFLVYNCKKDIFNNDIIKEKLSDGSNVRYIYWVPKLQK
jgi:formamidopyrimidine-DNA glycosylase